MSHYNVCYGEKTSCSACCGLNNLALTGGEKIQWLSKNTREFLELDLLNSKEVLKFRYCGEESLKKLMIRGDVYVCPFLGFTGGITGQTGCLLNPLGSPHPRIGQCQTPQHYSFYGERICQSYDCIAKQTLGTAMVKEEGDLYRRMFSFLGIQLDDKNYEVSSPAINPLTCSKFIANHNLIAVYRKIVEKNPAMEKPLLEIILRSLEITEIPVTSFEMPLTLDFFTDEQLWYVLGMLFQPQGYIFEAFQITREGIDKGNSLKSELVNLQ